MRYYAVFDTNVLVSSLLSKNPDSTTRCVIDLITDGTITPVFSSDILEEYEDVLNRSKFPFSKPAVANLIEMFKQFGQNAEPIVTGELFSADSDDRVFFEVVMAKREEIKEDEDAYLVTGNLRHFPVKPFIVTPAEMLAIING